MPAATQLATNSTTQPATMLPARPSLKVTLGENESYPSVDLLPGTKASSFQSLIREGSPSEQVLELQTNTKLLKESIGKLKKEVDNEPIYPMGRWNSTQARTKALDGLDRYENKLSEIEKSLQIDAMIEKAKKAGSDDVAKIYFQIAAQKQQMLAQFLADPAGYFQEEQKAEALFGSKRISEQIKETQEALTRLEESIHKATKLQTSESILKSTFEATKAHQDFKKNPAGSKLYPELLAEHRNNAKNFVRDSELVRKGLSKSLANVTQAKEIFEQSKKIGDKRGLIEARDLLNSLMAEADALVTYFPVSSREKAIINQLGINAREIAQRHVDYCPGYLSPISPGHKVDLAQVKKTQVALEAEYRDYCKKAGLGDWDTIKQAENFSDRLRTFHHQQNRFGEETAKISSAWLTEIQTGQGESFEHAAGYDYEMFYRVKEEQLKKASKLLSDQYIVLDKFPDDPKIVYSYNLNEAVASLNSKAELRTKWGISSCREGATELRQNAKAALFTASLLRIYPESIKDRAPDVESLVEAINKVRTKTTENPLGPREIELIKQGAPNSESLVKKINEARRKTKQHPLEPREIELIKQGLPQVVQSVYLAPFKAVLSANPKAAASVANTPSQHVYARELINQYRIATKVNEDKLKQLNQSLESYKKLANDNTQTSLTRKASRERITQIIPQLEKLNQLKSNLKRFEAVNNQGDGINGKMLNFKQLLTLQAGSKLDSLVKNQSAEQIEFFESRAAENALSAWLLRAHHEKLTSELRQIDRNDIKQVEAVQISCFKAEQQAGEGRFHFRGQETFEVKQSRGLKLCRDVDRMARELPGFDSEDYLKVSKKMQDRFSVAELRSLLGTGSVKGKLLVHSKIFGGADQGVDVRSPEFNLACLRLQIRSYYDPEHGANSDTVPPLVESLISNKRLDSYRNVEKQLLQEPY